MQYYSQRDTRWADIMYSSTGDKAQTIKTSGCGPTSMAMIVASFADPKITPIEMASYAVKNGYRTVNQGTLWDFFFAVGKLYNIEVAYGTFDEALRAVKDGDPVICNVGKGRWTSQGHYIVWHGIDGLNVLINDPNSTASYRSIAPVPDLRAQCKKYIICKRVVANLTKEEAKKILKEKAGLSDSSIQFLADDYRWGDDLVIKLAKAMK